MNNLQILEGLGLELPSPAYVIGAIVFGITGYIVYRRGRKTETSMLTWTGIGLMVYPYLVPQTWLLWVVGLALTGWAYTKWE